jgi:transglutaminase-like putative cysteine protease
LLFALLGFAPAALGAASEKDSAAKAKARTFELTCAATVTGLDPGRPARIWVPVPSSSDDQDVKVLSSQAQGAERLEGKFATEPEYGNRIYFVEARPDAKGKVTVTCRYRITRREVKGETGKKDREDAKRIARFLAADELVPVSGKPLELIQDRKLPDDPFAKARVLYDTVNEHMRYSKDKPGWGRGDSVWACDSRFGNCSDFHSLFISLARSQKLPARFEIGFSIPLTRGKGVIPGYHCWAFFKPMGKGWVPVDISEANKDPKMRDYYFGNLTPDRVTFSVGRDITLVPKQAGKPVNFLIYPHVEVDGKEHPQGKIDKHFSYEDVTE